MQSMFEGFRFQIREIVYMGGECGYIAALEILDAPASKWRYVIEIYSMYESTIYFEWEPSSIKDAAKGIASWRCFSNLGVTIQEFTKRKGFINVVRCTHFQPWFKAEPGAALCGENHTLAVPSTLVEFDIFKRGADLSVVFSRYSEDYKREIITKEKICLGVSKRERDHFELQRYDTWSPKLEKNYLVVFFDDGTSYEVEYNRIKEFASPVKNPTGKLFTE